MKKFLSIMAISALMLLAASCSLIDFSADAADRGAGAGAAVKGVSGLKIAIDAGHGGIDKGTSGTDTGVSEADLNLAIAQLLEGNFTQAGADVTMTRKSADVDYSGEGDTQKLKDMNNRIKLIRAQSSKVLVSIHMNTFSDRSVSGAQVFFQKGSAEGEKLAQSIQAALNDGVNGTGKRHVESNDYYLLKGVDCPSVIVECGFLSNHEDEKNLQDQNYQKKLVDCIYKGVCSYLGVQ